MNMRYLPWLALIAALATAATAQAAIYKYVDEDGNVTYSETPPPKGTDYDYMRKPKTPAGTGAAAAPAAQDKSRAAESIKKGAEEREKHEAIESELARAQETRRQNCEAAKKNLQAYTTFRRFQNDDGSVDRMDDTERGRKIEESKQQIREFCD